jgi:hypothetical protein
LITFLPGLCGFLASVKCTRPEMSEYTV